MVQRVSTVAFEGIEARAVDVQVQVAPGLPAFNIVGLPDKAVSEAKERVRAALKLYAFAFLPMARFRPRSATNFRRCWRSRRASANIWKMNFAR
jgi:hypothetical protein